MLLLGSDLILVPPLLVVFDSKLILNSVGEKPAITMPLIIPLYCWKASASHPRNQRLTLENPHSGMSWQALCSASPLIV